MEIFTLFFLKCLGLAVINVQKCLSWKKTRWKDILEGMVWNFNF